MATPPSAPEPATTYAQQLQMLRDRGLSIPDEPRALHCLSHCNYYRLIAYRRPLVDLTGSFVAGTSFEELWQLYCFDRQLRQLLSEALKRIEISVRAQWTYTMGHALGPQAFEDATVHPNQAWHAGALEKLDEELARSEDKARHASRKNGSGRPPIWCCSEVMSFGLLSRFYSIIGPFRLKKGIGGIYLIFPDVMKSLLEHAAYIRNLCAHHLLVWDRRLTVTLTLPISQPAHIIGSLNRLAPSKIYNSLVLFGHMVSVIEPGSDWMLRVRALVLAQQHPVARDMGFPEGWENLPIWGGPAAPVAPVSPA